MTQLFVDMLPGAPFARIRSRGIRVARSLTEHTVHARLNHLARQEPLLVTGPSLGGLENRRALLGTSPQGFAPNAVFVGLGLASRTGLSRGLPLDALGMLLTAERVRRDIAARRLVVLIADLHARCNGFSEFEVSARADEYVELLHRIRARLGFGEMQVVRAKELADDPLYRQVLAEVKSRAPDDEHAYFKHEVADIGYFHRSEGGVVKVGWALDQQNDGLANRDERVFDRKHDAWLGRGVPFLYCKAGRRFDDCKPKASPYLFDQDDRRLLLRSDVCPSEAVLHLQQGVSPSTKRAARKQLVALTRSYGALVAPLHGPLESRLDQLYSRLFSDPAS